MASLIDIFKGVNSPSTHSASNRTSVSGTSNLAGLFQNIFEQTRLSNLAREQEIRGYLGELVDLSKPGSAYHKAQLSDIATQTEKGVSKEQSGLISSGLFGTTTSASTPYRWEKGFAQPARMKLEDLMQQRYASALGDYAGFVERIQEPYPDYGVLLQAMQMQGQAAGRTTSGKRGGLAGHGGATNVIGRVQPTGRSYGGQVWT